MRSTVFIFGVYYEIRHIPPPHPPARAMSIPIRLNPVVYTDDGAVVISYKALNSPSASVDLAPAIGTPPKYVACLQLTLGTLIDLAFGSDPDCLGVIIVRDLPVKYKSLREQLLRQAYVFVHHLDDLAREQLSDPKSRYRCYFVSPSH